jgi:aldehyde dehydrogenase (NAD+)/betaine-aldehyde dehydrogenase
MAVSPAAERVTESFIDGASVSSAETYPNIDPSTGATLGDVARAGDKEIGQAVAAARRASRAWRATTPEQRSDLLSRLAGLIDDEVETLARLESEDSGKPLSQARNDALVCARYFRFYSHVIESYYGLSIPLRPDLHVYTRREPLGVTGHIVAWNYPMQLFGRAVGPAIAAGNCAVLKPADETPRTAVHLARLAAAAGLPPGVVNVVTGLGPEAGAALAAHPDVDHLSFVGSTEVGSLIAGAAARRVAPVTLELGGKSAHLVFADADVERAATTAANVILQNAGQTCSAGSRLLVDERVHDQVLRRIAERFGAVTIGPGITDPDLGPLVSRKQQDRVRGYVESATGADIVYGGTVAEPEGISGGAYFNPTLIDGVDPAARIAQEEIFGPVITVTTFGSEEEALMLANGTDYALIGAVWTTDLARAHRVAAQMDGGQIYVNTYGAGGGVELPFGGFRKSGYGREKGVEALDAYTATKTIVVQLLARGDDPPYPPVSARPGLIAKTAIVSGPPTRTESPGDAPRTPPRYAANK